MFEFLIRYKLSFIFLLFQILLMSIIDLVTLSIIFQLLTLENTVNFYFVTFDLNKNLAHYLKFNPLSLQNTDIVCKFEKKNSLNYHTILHYLETSPLAFIVSTNIGLTKFIDI